MLGIGWAEMLLIAAAAVVVVKPAQLPQTARSLGRAYRQFREIISESRRGLEKEIAEIEKLDLGEFNQTGGAPGGTVNRPKPEGPERS